jgi:hypothetical protein
LTLAATPFQEHFGDFADLFQFPVFPRDGAHVQRFQASDFAAIQAQKMGMSV